MWLLPCTPILVATNDGEVEGVADHLGGLSFWLFIAVLAYRLSYRQHMKKEQRKAARELERRDRKRQAEQPE